MSPRLERGAGGAAHAHFDVAVVGGGAAGLAAGLSAASLGARTLLVEEAPALGGNATSAFVHTLCGLYLAADAGPPEPANPGFAECFAQSLRQAGGAGEPERAGRVWVLPTDPLAIEKHAATLCEASDALETRVECRLVAARLARDDSDASELSLADARGAARREVEAQVVVDTSGDGALGACGGAASETAGPDEIQLPSYIVRLSGVPARDREGFGRLRLAATVARAARREQLPADCEAVLLRPAPGSQDAYLTLNLPRALLGAGGDPDARRHVEARARGIVEAIVAHLRATRPGYADCRVVAWPRRLGVREGARLRGRAVVDEAGLLAGRRCADEVALSTWPVELWHDHRSAVFRYPAGPYGIPLGALVSASHPRLGMAGRCLSASHEALGALRVLGTALATGEAIGIAAALAAARGCALASIPAADVRRERDARA